MHGIDLISIPAAAARAHKRVLQPRPHQSHVQSRGPNRSVIPLHSEEATRVDLGVVPSSERQLGQLGSVLADFSRDYRWTPTQGLQDSAG